MAISEWDQRQLCSDGGCVGVIGPDGTCKVCGRVAPDWGDERRRGLVATDDAGEGEDGGDGDDDQDELAPSAPAALGEMAGWRRRLLCPDGACIGVIGPDGRCKVCGKPATGEAEAEADEEAEGGDDDEDEEEAEGGDEDEEQDEDEDEEQDEEAAAADGGDELGERKLCPDGACIGVIGPDGRCKVCGKEGA